MASNRAMRLKAGSLARSRSSGSTAGSGSIQSWTIPSPKGPSRRTVGGTMRHPIASETTWAATSRYASVPSGKSSRRRSPSTGLYPHIAVKSGSGYGPRAVTEQYRALFEDATNRPTIATSPPRSSASAVAASSLLACLDRDLGALRIPGDRKRPGSEDLGQWLVERLGVPRGRGPARVRETSLPELVEKQREPIGKDRDLDLPEDDTHDPLAFAGLQKEGPGTRQPYRP